MICHFVLIMVNMHIKYRSTSYKTWKSTGCLFEGLGLHNFSENMQPEEV